MAPARDRATANGNFMRPLSHPSRRGESIARQIYHAFPTTLHWHKRGRATVWPPFLVAWNDYSTSALRLLCALVRRGVMHRSLLHRSRRCSIDERNHLWILCVRIEGGIVVHHGADGRWRGQRLLHVDGEVRRVGRLGIVGHRKLHGVRRRRDNLARDLVGLPLHRVPHLPRVFRFAVEEDELLVIQVQRLQVRSAGHHLGRLISWRRRSELSRVVTIRRKHRLRDQRLHLIEAVHAAVVLVVVVLGRLLDLVLGGRRSVSSRARQKPNSVLQIGRGLLRVCLSQQVCIVERWPRLSLRGRYRLQLLLEGVYRSRVIFLQLVVHSDRAIKNRRGRIF